MWFFDCDGFFDEIDIIVSINDCFQWWWAVERYNIRQNYRLFNFEYIPKTNQSHNSSSLGDTNHITNKYTSTSFIFTIYLQPIFEFDFKVYRVAVKHYNIRQKYRIFN